MTLQEPKSMDDVFYFTNRTLENGGWLKAWVYKPASPKGKGVLSLPKTKTGKPDKKATVYVDEAGNEYDRKETDATLFVEVKYKSPYTQKEGEAKTPYKRKKFKGVDAFVFEDQEGNKIPITKKLKEVKKK
ncbi:MAG: hypothetical protein ACMXYC_00940 [Candidatus Woesearchaeota archaeon]